ncbi:NAD(P)-binding protein [Armillaria gallica]|uniref:NAD(P)-binding protein n=1 Tax=Armillaria gallica TaxID=47427 RepID=A0A2H3E8S9_ARMGA|nr:NAD(P)-binding protein [Armillaria gallica]
MTILITGGTGKTGSRLTRRLLDANYPILLTSRKGVVPEPFKGVKFDWYDPSTFGNPFAADPNIDRIYIVAPDGGRAGEVIEPMKPFIDLAVTKGVNRFVLLSATTLEAGSPAMGKVHEYLLSLQVDYAILRPSWFYENLLTMHLHDIKENNTIITASADGKLGFVSADDIADLTFEALTDAKSHNTDHILTGPELLSYDDVAQILTDILGRKITHTRISVGELKDRYIAFGLPEDFATLLSSMDELNALGVEERIFGTPGKVTGKRTLRDFVETNRDSF